jgi:hypothetical protein
MYGNQSPVMRSLELGQGEYASERAIVLPGLSVFEGRDNPYKSPLDATLPPELLYGIFHLVQLGAAAHR